MGRRRIALGRRSTTCWLGLISAAVVLLGWPLTGVAQTQTSSGDITVSGVVPGPPPSQPASILVPTDGQVFQTQPITVSGTCQPDTFIQIDRNGVNAGVTNCSPMGEFSLTISLEPGDNQLIARTFDALFQEGPASAPVTVVYAPVQDAGPSLPPPPSPSAEPPAESATPPLMAAPDSLQACLAFLPRMVFSVRLQGGTPPYQLLWEWGDGESETDTIASSGTFSKSHTYQRAGLYRPRLTVTDQTGESVVLHCLAVWGETTGAGGLTDLDQDFRAFEQLIDRVWLIFCIIALLISIILCLYLWWRDQPRYKLHGLKRPATQS